MKATLVLDSNTDMARRMVFHVDDGTMIEVSANPKTGIMPKWALQLALEGHAHIHFENADGVLLSPGAVLGRKKSRVFPLFLLWVAVVSALVWRFYPEILNFLEGLKGGAQ